MFDVTEKYRTKGYLVTIDIEKAFDSLEKFGFRANFIDWIKIFLNEQKSCVINGGVTTQYCNFEKRVRKGDPVSA